jgi:murein DD-endopeptidase MepM/ murein hydrolase activator NlpD
MPRRGPARRLSLLVLIIPLIVGLFGAPAAGPVAGDELSDAIARQKALEDQIKGQQGQVARINALQSDLQAQIAATKKALAGINADLVAVRAQIDAMVIQINEVRATYDNLVLELRVMDTNLARLVDEENTRRRELRERKALLAERIRTAYETDQTSPLELFLSGASFTDVLSEVSYSIDVAEQDRALAEQIAQDREMLAALHQTVDTTRSQTDELRKETAAQKRMLDRQLADLEVAKAQLVELEKKTAAALARQKQAYASLEKNEAALRRSIAEGAAAQRQLEDKIERLVREQARDGKIPSEYNGTLAWPMGGTVTQNFGCTGFSWEPPLGDCDHFHRGIDIAAPLYTPIRAAAAGTVVFAGPNPYDPYPKAWIVIIAHSTNLLTWYGHVDNAVRPPAVQAGEFVREGQVIAYNGLTGRTTGPHLHWMVEFNGDFANPRLFL